MAVPLGGDIVKSLQAATEAHLAVVKASQEAAAALAEERKAKDGDPPTGSY